MKNLLVEYVQLITEAQLISLRDGREVEYGSNDHLYDLEEMVKALEFHRNKYGRGTDDRTTFARARNKLATRIKKIRRKLATNDSKGR